VLTCRARRIAALEAELAERALQSAAWLMAWEEMLACGIDISFAPRAGSELRPQTRLLVTARRGR